MRARGAEAIELQAVTVQAESLVAGIRDDQRIEFRVAELRDRATAAADQVVVVVAARDFVTNAPVPQRKSADEIQVLKQLHSSKDRRPSDAWRCFRNLFDGEGSALERDGVQYGSTRASGSMAEAFKPREYLIRSLWHRSIVGRRQGRCQREATANEPPVAPRGVRRTFCSSSLGVWAAP